MIDQPGTEPPIVLLHGYPDDSRIYRRLLPHLAPRRAVAFDFLGYGHSDRPEGRPDPRQHEAELAAVLDSLEIERALLVGHDAGGPVAVNFTLDHPGRVSRLVLMDTYYGSAPQLRMPEMIHRSRWSTARVTNTSAPTSPATWPPCSATPSCM